MMGYEFDCGIKVPHKHTGEIVEGHHVEYWCPDKSGWGKARACKEHVHTRARTQTTMTEIIELYPGIPRDFIDFVHTSVASDLEKQFMLGT